MKFIRVAFRSANDGFFRRQFNRSLSSFPNANIANSNSDPGNYGNPSANSAESIENFEKSIFGDNPEDTSKSFFRKLGKIEKDRQGSGMGFTPDGDLSEMFGGGDDDTFTTLNDGIEGRLKQAATYFEVNSRETVANDYTYRADMNLKPRMTYTPEDLNIRKPGIWKPSKRLDFEVTTKEALQNADFRNVRFLANFLTEAGIIVKRSQTGISAKAQRKVAREIKKARAFGLLPFTTMGTKSFVFGKTMESLDQDFELDTYDMASDADKAQDPIAE